jgi:excinuclease ABC subunit C
MRRFGSLKRLRAASVEDLIEVPGIGRRTAEAIVAALAAPQDSVPAVNVTTGEVLDDETREDGAEQGGNA